MKEAVVEKLAEPRTEVRQGDVKTVAAATDILEGKSQKGVFARLLPFLGPAFVASIAYVDPGNFATNIQGGAQFGYTLLWVILGSNLMAMLIQSLSAKLGMATGKNLAELCRERFPRPVVIFMWALMELMAIATDLAEFIGAAVGFNLLLGIPLLPAGLLTAFTTFVILSLERRGFRPLEAVITGFVGVISVAYLVEMFIVRPPLGQVAVHAVIPQFQGPESLLLATGILGATVMPHVIFLHSALTQGRIITRDPAQLKRLFRFELVDVTVAMGLAGLVNMAMLIMAAATFNAKGLLSIGTLEEAHQTLEPLLGSAASWLFALSLLASGLSSSTVGTMAGQVIMQGFIERRVSVWLRRIVTVVPSLVVISLQWDPTRTLVISQVILSFALPFAVIPLVLFTRDKKLMGVLSNSRLTTVLASIVAALIIGLNLFLLYETFFRGS